MPEDYRDPEVMRRLYIDEGLSINQIADRLYITETTVRYQLIANNIPRRPRGGSRKNGGPKPTLVRVGDEMLTIRQIAERAKVSWDTASKRVKKGMTGDKLLAPSRQGPGRKKTW